MKSLAVKDWPHLDQTGLQDVFKCVQGQVVLTHTDACFRATPKSHLRYKEIMDICKVDDTNRSNWYKFTDAQIVEIAKMFPHFQIPIRVPKGSVILWLSTTIHSSLATTKKEEWDGRDPFKGWRGVVYVCHRPMEEFSAHQLEVLEQCIDGNHGTNHWGTKVFKAQMIDKKLTRYVPNSDNMDKMISNAALVYDILGWRPKRRMFIVGDEVDEGDIGKQRRWRVKEAYRTVQGSGS